MAGAGLEGAFAGENVGEARAPVVQAGWRLDMGNKWILEGREGPVRTVQALEHLSWLAWVAVQWWPWWEEITDVVQRLVLFYSLQAMQPRCTGYIQPASTE